MGQITLQCKVCNKEFKVYPYRKDTAKYCSTNCQNFAQKGKHHHPETEFKKGQIPHNYIGLTTHPKTGRSIFRLEGKANYNYRRLIELKIGRKLENKEHVHHIDNYTSNDSFDNLVITNPGDHKRIHNRAYGYVCENGLKHKYMRWFNKNMDSHKKPYFNAYGYLVQAGQIYNYMIWLKANYSEIKFYTIDELIEGGVAKC